MRRFVGAALVVLFLIPTSASGALPPFELAQKGIAEAREKRGPITVDLRVTRSGKQLIEYRLKGTFQPGDTATLEGPSSLKLGPESITPLRLLWIALLASDPVAALTKQYGFVDTDRAVVGLEDGFVYVYGDNPKVSVARDMRTLVAIELRHDGHHWRVRLSRREDQIVGALVTRDGSAVLTARSRP